MNEPLKLKLFSIYGQLLNEKVLREAWKHVKRNGGCAGVDKISVKDFEKNLDENILEMLTELEEKTYKPSPALRQYIPKKNGKKRPLGIPTIKDRVIQQALVSRIEPFFEENVFNEHSCGFRPKRGVELAIKKVISRLEYEFYYIYDFDIKGYFDNIPHKKLMKVLNKYISDGTVLDLIWKWLKAGYMEDKTVIDSKQGLQQGGVISPILANIYLNELDWELQKANHKFVRYADDAIVMCKTPEELERAKALVHKVLKELGLELAEDKTHDVDFHKDDFDYLNFSFKHERKSKVGNKYYLISPLEDKLKEFKREIKRLIPKNNTKSFEQWKTILNPIIRGKVNYFLISMKALNAVHESLKEINRYCKCRIDYEFINYLNGIDGYIRRRLRHNFHCRGKLSATWRSSLGQTNKYPTKLIHSTIGIVSVGYLKEKLTNAKISIEEYCDKLYEEEKSYKQKSLEKMSAKQKAKRKAYFKRKYAVAI